MDGDKHDPYSGVTLSYYTQSSGIDGTDATQRKSRDYDTKQIITTYGNTALLLEDGSVWVAGRNDEGQVWKRNNN